MIKINYEFENKICSLAYARQHFNVAIAGGTPWYGRIIHALASLVTAIPFLNYITVAAERALFKKTPLKAPFMLMLPLSYSPPFSIHSVQPKIESASFSSTLTGTPKSLAQGVLGVVEEVEVNLSLYLSPTRVFSLEYAQPKLQLPSSASTRGDQPETLTDEILKKIGEVISLLDFYASVDQMHLPPTEVQEMKSYYEKEIHMRYQTLLMQLGILSREITTTPKDQRTSLRKEAVEALSEGLASLKVATQIYLNLSNSKESL